MPGPVGPYSVQSPSADKGRVGTIARKAAPGTGRRKKKQRGKALLVALALLLAVVLGVLVARQYLYARSHRYYAGLRTREEEVT